MTPVKAIRAKCIDCMCGQIYEVTKCPCEDCSLWPFRMGKNPNCKRKKGDVAGTSDEEESEVE